MAYKKIYQQSNSPLWLYHRIPTTLFRRPPLPHPITQYRLVYATHDGDDSTGCFLCPCLPSHPRAVGKFRSSHPLWGAPVQEITLRYPSKNLVSRRLSLAGWRGRRRERYYIGLFGVDQGTRVGGVGRGRRPSRGRIRYFGLFLLNGDRNRDLDWCDELNEQWR